MEKKSGKTKIIAIVLAVVMVISIAAFAVVKIKNKSPEESSKSEEAGTSTVEFSLESSEYTSKITVAGTDGQVYLPTAVSGIYYTADLAGSIAYYQYSGGAFTPCPAEVKSFTAKMSASTETIPVKVSYITVNGQTIGYGLFTSDMDSSVDLYDYAFVELLKKPSGYGTGYLLICDYDKEDFYRADKTYNEIYEVSDLKNCSLSSKLSQNTRLIDENGTYRQDWDMMSDEFIAALGSAKYFMSSRYYTSEETGRRTDIMAYSNAYKPTIVAKDIVDQWFVNDDSGMHYMKKTDDGFKSVVKKDKKTSDVVTFTGDYFEDYLRSGNYVVNKKTNAVTNLLTGESLTIAGVDLTSATEFSITADGKKAAFGCPGTENKNGAMVQTVIYCTTDGSQSPEIYVEPLLRCEESSFIWVDSNHCMSARYLTDDGSQTGSVIYTY